MDKVIRNGFNLGELISKEEKAVAYGVSNRQKFNKRDINRQLSIARKLK